MRNILLAAVAAALVLAAGAARAETTTIDRIVAIVGQDVVTLSELQTEMAPRLAELQKRLTGGELAHATDRLYRETLNSLIDKYLQLQEARIQGITVDKAEIDGAVADIMERNKMDEAAFRAALLREGYNLDDYKKTLEEQLMIIRLVSAAVKSRIIVEEAEIAAHYQRNLDKYTEHSSVRIANIFFPAKLGDMEGARKNALEARAKVLAGTPFEEMAVACTGDPKAAETCVLGTFGKGELSKEVEGASYALPSGGVSEPIELEGGYQLIKVMERTEGRVRPIEEVRAEVVEDLSVKKGETLFAGWIQELRDRTYVEIRQ